MKLSKKIFTFFLSYCLLSMQLPLSNVAFAGRDDGNSNDIEYQKHIDEGPQFLQLAQQYLNELAHIRAHNEYSDLVQQYNTQDQNAHGLEAILNESENIINQKEIAHILSPINQQLEGLKKRNETAAAAAIMAGAISEVIGFFCELPGTLATCVATMPLHKRACPEKILTYVGHNVCVLAQKTNDAIINVVAPKIIFGVTTCIQEGAKLLGGTAKDYCVNQNEEHYNETLVEAVEKTIYQDQTACYTVASVGAGLLTLGIVVTPIVYLLWKKLYPKYEIKKQSKGVELLQSILEVHILYLNLLKDNKIILDSTAGEV